MPAVFIFKLFCLMCLFTSMKVNCLFMKSMKDFVNNNHYNRIIDKDALETHVLRDDILKTTIPSSSEFPADEGKTMGYRNDVLLKERDNTHVSSTNEVISHRSKRKKGCCNMGKCNISRSNVGGAFNNQTVADQNDKHKKGCCKMCKRKMNMTMNPETSKKMKCCSMCGKPLEIMDTRNITDNESENDTVPICSMCRQKMDTNMTIKNDTSLKSGKNMMSCPMCGKALSITNGNDDTKNQTEVKTAPMCPMCRKKITMNRHTNVSNMDTMGSMCGKHTTNTTAMHRSTEIRGHSEKPEKPQEDGKADAKKPSHLNDGMFEEKLSLSGIIMPAILGACGAILVILIGCLMKRKSRRLRQRSRFPTGSYQPVKREEMSFMMREENP